MIPGRGACPSVADHPDVCVGSVCRPEHPLVRRRRYPQAVMLALVRRRSSSASRASLGAAAVAVRLDPRPVAGRRGDRRVLRAPCAQADLTRTASIGPAPPAAHYLAPSPPSPAPSPRHGVGPLCRGAGRRRRWQGARASPSPSRRPRFAAARSAEGRTRIAGDATSSPTGSPCSRHAGVLAFQDDLRTEITRRPG